MFVVHTFKRTLQWLVHSWLSPQFSGNGVQLFLSPDEAGSIIENRDGENLRQTQISLFVFRVLLSSKKDRLVQTIFETLFTLTVPSVLHLYSVTGDTRLHVWDEIMATYVSDAS